MIKKIFLVIFVFLLVVLSSAFTDIEKIDSRGFEIRAYKIPEIWVSVTPIDNGPILEAEKGMPFDLTADDVKYHSKEASGREIATWSLYSEYPNPDVYVKASPLVHESSSKSVDYSLWFEVGSDTGGEYYNVSSSNSDEFIAIGTLSDNDPSFEDCRILFILAEGVDMSEEQYPAGQYTANVSIKVEVEI